MKRLLVLLLVIAIYEAVRIEKIEKIEEKSFPFQLIVGNCTSTQSTTVAEAIEQCQNQDISQTSICFHNYMKVNTTGKQEWNLVISPHEQTQLGIQFWYLNDCYTQIIDNQNFNRTYILWPDKIFLNSTQNSQSTGDQKGQQEKAINKFQNNLQDQNLKTDNCSNWRKNLVNVTLQYCDVKSNKVAASCIANRLKFLASDYWNVVVASSNSTHVNPWYYRYCDISVTNFGTYQRNIQVWKAWYD